MWNRLRIWRSDNFVIRRMKNVFYDAHSKTVIKNCLRMCLSGNPIIRGNENDNGFHKTVFVFIPKITTYLILVPPFNTLSFELSPSSPSSTTHWPPLRPHSLWSSAELCFGISPSLAIHSILLLLVVSA